jgi:erythronate-4-phosphate dehydrogenase
MKVVADAKIPLVAETLSTGADVETIPTAGLTPEVARTADALLVRSETRVDEALLRGSRVRFVGTATIGFDHVDRQYLQKHGIAFAYAPGSNANSVAEYVVAALLVLAERNGFLLKDRVIGVAGVGNVGSRVVRYARALGMKVMQNDPPRARESGSAGFVSLDALMDADIITVHVPLTRAGEDRTFHLFDDRRLAKMKPGSIFINTSRGAVHETGALAQRLNTRYLTGCVLDVWENEPDIDAGLVPCVSIATPHIAGYSREGRIAGARMILESLSRHFHLDTLQRFSTGDQVKSGRVGIRLPGGTDQHRLLAAVSQSYDILDDDRRLRAITQAADRGTFFRTLRHQYPVRREFPHYAVHDLPDNDPLFSVLSALGFHTSQEDS